MTSRRDFLKFIGLGVTGYAMDLDKLLWVPGQKKIFLVEGRKGLSLAEIVAAEWEAAIPMMKAIFEQDSIFYREYDKFLARPIYDD